MANFEAQVRTNYRDVAGLVLSCAREDLIEDTNHPNFVKEWVNRAPGLPSKPAIRNPGEPLPTYLGGRFSNPRQVVHDLQPGLGQTVSGEQQCVFERARSSYLVTDFIVDGFPDSIPGDALACGYQFTVGADASNNQVMFATDPGTQLVAQRRNGAGDAVISTGVPNITVSGDHPSGTFLYTGENGGSALWTQNNTPFGTGSATNPNQIPAASRLFIGRDGTGNYLDGTFDTLNIWAAELSPKTQDFIWQSINRDGTDFSSSSVPRASIENVVWTDATADPTLDQYDRLRPQTGFPHRYLKVVLPDETNHRIQVAATVDGIVQPDSNLGGDLFTYDWTEFPGPPFIVPLLDPEPGWSAIADFDLSQEGHYTLTVSRPNGGGIILHFDVEIV